jgi:hypothetical protein
MRITSHVRIARRGQEERPAGGGFVSASRRFEGVVTLRKAQLHERSLSGPASARRGIA